MKNGFEKSSISAVIHYTMGNCIPTHRERKRQRFEQQILQLYAAAQSRLQPVAPPPVAPKPSYDELVVAEANRRIEEEKQKGIAIAEKKRFEEDVAEKIALAKDPNHVTRAMIAEYNKPENVKARRDASLEKRRLQIMEMWCPSHLHLTDVDRNKLDKLRLEHDKLWNSQCRFESTPNPGQFADKMYGNRVRIADIIKEKETIHKSYTDRLSAHALP